MDGDFGDPIEDAVKAAKAKTAVSSQGQSLDQTKAVLFGDLKKKGSSNPNQQSNPAADSVSGSPSFGSGSASSQLIQSNDNGFRTINPSQLAKTVLMENPLDALNRVKNTPVSDASLIKQPVKNARLLNSDEDKQFDRPVQLQSSVPLETQSQQDISDNKIAANQQAQNDAETTQQAKTEKDNPGSWSNALPQLAGAIAQIVVNTEKFGANVLRDAAGKLPGGEDNSGQDLYTDTSGINPETGQYQESKVLSPYGQQVQAGSKYDPAGSFILGLNADSDTLNKNAQQNQLPHTFLGNTASGAIHILPDIAAVDLLGPEAEGGEVATTGKNIITRLSEAASNPFTKLQAAKGVMSGYNEAKQSGGSGLMGGISGGVEGETSGTGQMLLANIAGDIVSPKIASALKATGLIQSGKYTKMGADMLADATVFGAYPLASNLIQGKPIDWNEVQSGVGTGLGFGLMKAKETAATHGDVEKQVNKTLNDAQGLALQNFINASPDAIAQVYQMPDNSGELTAKAVDFAHKTMVEPDLAKKQQFAASASTFSKSAGIKATVEAIITDPQGFVSDIQNGDLPDNVKQQLIQKAAATNQQFSPDEQSKNQSASAINDINGQIATSQQLLNDPNTDPITKIKAQAAIDALTKQKELHEGNMQTIISKQINGEPVVLPKPTGTPQPIKLTDEQTIPNQEVPAQQPTDETAGAGKATATVDETTENNPVISINEVKDKPILYKGEKATIEQEGQTLIAKITGSNREYELGNADQIGDQSIKDFDIEHQNSVVNTDDDGNIIVRGKKLVNNYSDPLAAINRDGDGNVVSVNLETEDGKKRTFKGDVAEDIAYQIHLKELNKDNGTADNFEQFAENDEPTKTEIMAGENAISSEKKSVENNGKVYRKPAKPKVKEENKNAIRIEKPTAVHVQPAPENSGEMGEGNAGLQEPAGESAPRKEVQSNGEEKTPSVGRQPTGEHGVKDSKTVYIPTENVNTDTDRFQPRGNDFSKASADKVINNFDDNKLDPIVIYKDSNGRDYVLAGHSRLEAHKQLDALPDNSPIKQKAIENGYEPGQIKARYFDGTEAEAKEFADRSNDLGNKNTDYESAASIRKMRKSGATQKAIDERAEQDFGKDARYIKALSYLNPNGDVINALKQMGESGDKASRTALEKTASWIGAARQRLPELTDSHEKEMYNFLNDKKNDGITTQADFLSKIASLVNNLHFNPEEPLNLNKLKQINPGQQQYEHEYANLKGKVEAKQAEIDLLNDRLNNPKNPNYLKPTDPDYDAMVKYAEKLKAKKNTELKSLRADLLELAQKKGLYLANGISQTGLFDAPLLPDEAGKLKTNITPDKTKIADEELAPIGLSIQKIIKDEQQQSKQSDSTGSSIEPTPVEDNAENVQESEPQPGATGASAAGDQGQTGSTGLSDKKIAIRKKVTDATKDFDDFIHKSRANTNIGFNPLDFISKASKLMSAYAELGLYKFGQMLESMRNQFGSDFVDQNIADLKKAYDLTRADAPDEHVDKFDDEKAVRQHIADNATNIKGKEKEPLVSPENKPKPVDEMADLKTAFNKKKTIEKQAGEDDLLKSFAELDPRYFNPDEVTRYNDLTKDKTPNQFQRDEIAKFIDDVHSRQDDENEEREKQWYKQVSDDPDFEDDDVKNILKDVSNIEGNETDLENTKENNTAQSALKKILNYGRDELRKLTAPAGFEGAKKAILAIDEDKMSTRDLRDINRTIEGMINDGNFAGSGKWVALHESVNNASDILQAKNNRGFESGKTSKIPGDLRSLPQNIEIVTKDSKLASTIQHKSGIFDISAGNAKVNKAMNIITKAYGKLTDGMGKDISSVENRYKRGILATFLQQAETDSPEDHFNRYKDYIDQTAKKLLKSTKTSEQREGDLVRSLYEKHIKDATSSDDIVKSLTKDNPDNLKIVKFFIDKQKEVYPALRRSALMYSGKELPLIENYTSTQMKRLRGVDDKPIASQMITDPASMDSEDNPTNTGQARTTISRRKGMRPDRVMNLNFDGMQLNRLRESHYDVQTLAARYLYDAIRKQPDFKEALGNSQKNVNVISDGVSTMVRAQLGFNHTDPVAKMVLDITNMIGTAGTRIALKGIDQFAKHYPSRTINTLGNLGGDVGLYFKAMAKIGTGHQPIFNESGIGLRGLSKGGTDIEGSIRQFQKYDFSTAGEWLNAIHKVFNKADGIWSAPLTLSDELVAKHSWAAYYMQDLQKRGVDVDNIDFNTEHEHMDKEAAAYAEQMVSRNEIPNDPTQRAIFDQKGDVRSAGDLFKEIAKKLAFPFTTYSRNMQVRLENDIRKFNGGNRKEAARSIVSTIAETASFQSIKILLKIGTGAAAGYALSQMGFNAPTHDSKKDWKQLPSQTFDDMFLAGLGSTVDGGIKDGINNMYKLARGNESDYIFKNYDPGQFGETNFGLAGMYGILPQKIHEATQEWQYAKGTVDGEADAYSPYFGAYKQQYESQLSDKQRELAKGVFALDILGIAGMSGATSQRLNSAIFNQIKMQKAPVRFHSGMEHNKKSDSYKVGWPIEEDE